MKKILFICLSNVDITNSAMQGNLALVHGFVDKGYDVDFVCLKSLISNLNEYPYLKKVNLIEIDSRSSDSQTHRKWYTKFLSFIWHKLFIYDKTIFKINKIKINSFSSMHYDLVFTSSDPISSHYYFKKLAKRGITYGKWLEIWGDPIADDITNPCILPKFIIKQTERKVISWCDYCVYVSPLTLNSQKKHFPKLSSKMRFFPLPYEREEIYKETNGDKYIIGYYGAYFSDVRNIVPFYEACARMKKETDVSIFGNSDLVLTQTENVHIYDRGDVSAHKSIANLYVCVLNKKGGQIPAKLNYLSGTNKAVLIILDGDCSEDIFNYLSKYNRFYFSKNDPMEIEKTIRRIMKDNKKFNPSRYFHYDLITSDILKIL